jgi:hypothetical protein
MRTERTLLRIGEYLVGRACRRLPPEIRDERFQEWAAELPAILHDCEIRLAPHRAVRMLGYAADTLRGTALTPSSPRRRSARLSTLVLSQLVIADLVAMAGSSWDTTRAPGDWVNYLLAGWFFIFFLVIVAWRPTRRWAHTGGHNMRAVAK